MTLAYAPSPDEGDDMPRRRRPKSEPPPPPPRRFVAKVAGRAVAELSVRANGDIAPGSVLWLCDPSGVSGPDREKAAAGIVRAAGLDPKTDHDTVYAALWSQAPKRP